jgi:hypothetical protein
MVLEVKRLKCEVGHSPLSISEGKNDEALRPLPHMSSERSVKLLNQGQG